MSSEQVCEMERPAGSQAPASVPSKCTIHYTVVHCDRECVTEGDEFGEGFTLLHETNGCSFFFACIFLHTYCLLNSPWSELSFFFLILC